MTTFREAVESHLATQLAIPFVSGKLEGPQRRDIGCTFPAAKSEVPGHVNDEYVFVKVRVFKAFVQERDPAAPTDPAALEALAESLQTAMSTVQTGQGPWFNRVTDIEWDMDSYGFEATILGQQSNLGL